MNTNKKPNTFKQVILGLFSAICISAYLFAGYIIVDKGMDIYHELENYTAGRIENKNKADDDNKVADNKINDEGKSDKNKDKSDTDKSKKSNKTNNEAKHALKEVGDISVNDYYQIIPNIVEKTSPSIVTISSIVEQNPSSFYIFRQGGGGTGSGIIFKEDNKNIYIVTNYHVVKGHDRLEVILNNKSVSKAELIGYNSLDDIAVIKVAKKDLEHKEDVLIATLGTSDNLRVGESVIAIGNPLGVEHSLTVTSGIISALDRQIGFRDGSNQSNLIQTDAAINPGNSGGALLNIKGEVIGINNGKYVSESVEGIGFAIPIDKAKSNIDKILENKKGEDIAYKIDDDRAVIGIKMSDINAEINQSTGMTFGVYIVDVVENSGAKEAGVKKGDIIYGLNGAKVVNSKDLIIQLSRYKAGDTITLNVLRENGLINIDVKLSSYKDIKKD